MLRYVATPNGGVIRWRQAGTPIANLLTPTGIASTETFGTPTLSGGSIAPQTTPPYAYRFQTIGGRTGRTFIRWRSGGAILGVTPVGIGSSETFGTPTVSTRQLTDADLLAIETQIFDTAIVEGTLTLRQTLRILLAVAAGNETGGPSAPQFKSLDGTKTRVGGIADVNGNRTRNTLDGT